MNSLDEKFSYDELYRLLGITLANGSTENSFSYDILGNMLTKGDVGTYTYPPTGSAQPHGVSTVKSSAGTTSFSYDQNGNVVDLGNNVTAQGGVTVRHITSTIFNMARSAVYGGHTVLFQYDADHNRSMKTASEGITYYLPDGELTPSTGAGPVWHTYFEVGGERIAEDYGPTGALAHHYFLNDYQNSIGLVTTDGYVYGGAGTAQNEGSDVFGQPRLPNGAPDPNWNANGATKRRYINQEDLTDIHLIDLNARLYEPLLGKFLAPDPVIADQEDSQSWNAYAYSRNNPMSKSDPTGLNDGSECDGGCMYATSLATGGFNAGMAGAAQRPQLYSEVGANGVSSNLTIQQATEAYANGASLGPGVRGDIASYVAGQLGISVSGLLPSNSGYADGSIAADHFGRGAYNEGQLAPLAIGGGALACAVAEPCGAGVLIGGALAGVATSGLMMTPGDQATNSSDDKGTKAGKDNKPKGDLPRDPITGNYLPHPDAEGSHSTFGTRPGSNGETYRQGATFGADGTFEGRTDVTDHGRGDHENPHFHPAVGPNSVGSAERVPQ